MKNFLALLALILLSSCGKGLPVVAPHHQDGRPFIDDSREAIKSTEKNENILRLPKIQVEKMLSRRASFQVSELDGNVSVKSLSENSSAEVRSLLRQKILRLTQKSIASQNYEITDLLSESDEDTYIFPSWSSTLAIPFQKNLYGSGLQNLIQDSGLVAIDFSFSHKNTEGLESFSAIELSSSIYDVNTQRLLQIRNSMLMQSELTAEKIEIENSNSLRPFYTAEAQNLSAQVVKDSITHDKSQAITINNFVMATKDGDIIRYNELKESLQTEYCKVIISMPSYTEVLYVKNFKDIRTFLTTLDAAVSFNEYGQVTTLYELKNSLNLPVDWINFSATNSLLGIWKIFGQNDGTFTETDSFETISPEKTLIITYALGSELYASSRVTSVVSTGKVKNGKIAIENINGDDEVMLSLSATITSSTYKESKIDVPVIVYENTMRSCQAYDKVLVKTTTSPLIFNNSNFGKHLNVRIGGKEVKISDLLPKNGKVIYKKGSEMMLRLHFYPNVLGKNHSIEIIMPTVVDNKKMSLGFQRWSKCRYLRLENFRTESYELTPKPHVDQTKYEFTGEVYKTGTF